MIKKKKKWLKDLGRLNLERVFNVTHFEEILESLMYGGFLSFSLKFA
jgi:hypothetical protein